MRWSALGPLEIIGVQGPVELTAAKGRAVATVLALHAGHVVSTETLAEVLWGDDLPQSSAKSVQTYVFRIRKAAGANVVVRKGTGYVLAVEDAEVDVRLFEEAAGRARIASRQGDAPGAAEAWTEALGLWRGGPELPPTPRGMALTAAWHEAYLAGLTERIDAELAMGRHAELVGELEALVGVHPLVERLWAQLMVILYRCGRQADALQAYQRLRTTLVTELGVEPSADLRQLEAAILAQDSSLDAPKPSPSDRGEATSTTLPSGVVTFMLTDVAGSTHLWEANAVAMSAALVRHDAIVSSAVLAHGGSVLKPRGEGDSTFNVFRRATDAAAAASIIQRSLRAEDWPDGCNIKVRIALHTGEALERDGDYFGRTVNRASRLRAIAATDEILISQATAELIVDHLPTELSLRPVGTRQLQDLARPEVIYQLVALPEPGSSPEPAGTSRPIQTFCTLLSTEIEAAAELWERDPDNMNRVVQEFHDLVAQTTRRRSGHVVSLLGDRMYATFDVAGGAVRSAIEIQSQVRARAWPGMQMLAVRIGLHTGRFYGHGDELLGPDLTIADRLQIAAHGGQILLSDETARASLTCLRDGEGFRNLGQHVLAAHRLVEVNMIVADTLPSEFPPLRLSRAGHDELPVETTRLVGRGALISEVVTAVRDERLVSLWGAGGVGKSRLAVRAARLSRGPFDDGVRFVDLSVLRDAGRAADVTLAALHGVPAAGESAHAAVLRAMRPARLLLLIDSCEYVLDEVRELVGSIIDRCPWVHVLATSHEALRIPAERRIVVPPLEVPPSGVTALDELLQYAAVQLFVQRARMVDSTFKLSPRNASFVAEICRRVGGLPLALELVAGRLDVETAAELGSASSEAQLLSRLAEEKSPHQRGGTLSSSLNWSVALLSLEEQSLLAAVGVFAGPFTRQMALDLVDADGGAGFDRLVRSGLMTREAAGSNRFRLFEPTREFARSLLGSSEIEGLEARHAELMLNRAERCSPQVRTAEEAKACEVLQADFADHRQAVAWFLDRASVDLASRLVIALFQFCHFQLLAEVYEWATNLARLLDDDSPFLTEVCGAAALGAWFGGDTELAIELGERAIEAAPSSRQPSAFWARIALVDALAYSGRLAEVGQHYRSLVEESRRSPERFWQITGLGYEVIGLLMFGRPERALQRADEAVTLARELANPDCSHWALYGLGRALAPSDPEAACQAFEEAMDATRRVGSRWNLSLDLLEWVNLKRRLDDLPSAAQGLLELLDLLCGAGNRSQLSQAFLEGAHVLASHGDLELALIVLLGRAGLPEMPKGDQELSAGEDLLASLEKAVGPSFSRILVRARSIGEQDLVVLCRGGLETIVRDVLRPADSNVRRRPDLVVVYTDLVASIGLDGVGGDELFLQSVREHNVIVRRRLEIFGGVEFAFTGNGVGARFDEVEEALRFSMGLQADLDDAKVTHPNFQIQVRIGLARGEALEEEGRLFGQTVVRAVRVCAAAEAGQVLAGDDVAFGVDPAVASFLSIGTYPLKGFGTSVPLYEAKTLAAVRA